MTSYCPQARVEGTENKENLLYTKREYVKILWKSISTNSLFMFKVQCFKEYMVDLRTKCMHHNSQKINWRLSVSSLSLSSSCPAPAKLSLMFPLSSMFSKFLVLTSTIFKIQNQQMHQKTIYNLQNKLLQWCHLVSVRWILWFPRGWWRWWSGKHGRDCRKYRVLVNPHTFFTR